MENGRAIQSASKSSHCAAPRRIKTRVNAIVGLSLILVATFASTASGQAQDAPAPAEESATPPGLLEPKRETAVALPLASDGAIDRTIDRFEAEHPRPEDKRAKRKPRSMARLGTGMASAYPFNEGSGVIAGDILGDHDGVVHGAQWVETGKYGGALEFDGDNDIVTIPDSNDLDFASGFTLEAWVRPRVDSDYWKPVVTKETSSGFMAYQLYAQSDQASKPLGFVANGDWSYRGVVGSSPLPLETWSHLAMTSDGIQMRLYVNGVLQATAPAYVPQTSDGALQIGGNEVWHEYFDGRIDELRIYGETSSAADIQADRDTPLASSPPVPGTEVALAFQEGTGSIANDAAGDNDGTVTGATWTSQGKYGGALDFDGVDDVVTIPDSNGLDFTGGLTLEAWVKPRSDPHTWAPVVTKETQSGFMGYQLYAETSNAGKPAGFVANGDWSYTGVSGTSVLPIGSWSHLAVTSDGTQMRIYVGGVLKATGPSYTAQASNGDLQIGAAPVFGEYFNGLVDEVRLYNRVLSASEVVADRDTPIDYTPPTVQSSSGTLITSSSAIQGQTSYTLNVSATDAGSGVKTIEVFLDDDSDQAAFTATRTAAECNLTRGRCPAGFQSTWTTTPYQFGEGVRTVSVVATDQAGLKTTQQFTITVTTDIAPGTLTISATSPASDGSYDVVATGVETQASGRPTSGISSMELLVDGKSAGVFAPGCTAGGCNLSHSFRVAPGHPLSSSEVNVVMYDRAGNGTVEDLGKQFARYNRFGYSEEYYGPGGRKELLAAFNGGSNIIRIQVDWCTIADFAKNPDPNNPVTYGDPVPHN